VFICNTFAAKYAAWKKYPQFFLISHMQTSRISANGRFRMAGSMPVKVKYGKFCATVYIMPKCKQPQ
jgi:hypothetical protein